MFKQFIAFLDKKCLSRGSSIILFAGFIIATAAFWVRNYTYEKCLEAIKYEYGHEAQRQFLQNYKLGSGLPYASITDAERVEREQFVRSFGKKLGIGEDEISGKKVKRLHWNTQLQYFYWDYPNKAE